jgi:arylsulfatase A
MQLFNLDDDPGEQTNLLSEHPDKVKELLRLLDEQVRNGRSTPGETLSNDRDVEFLPAGVTIPSDG